MRLETSLRARLETGEPLVFSWSMMPASLSTEVFAKGPFEACCIDMQHGYCGYTDFIAMAAPVFAAQKPLLVRMPLEDWGFAARAFDAGASALIAPMINTPADAAKFVEVTKFPPIGARSFGAYRDTSAEGIRDQGYLAGRNSQTLCLAMIETQEALDNLDEICAVEGIDGVFVGPFDLCISLTRGEGPIEPASGKMLEVLKSIARAGKKNQVFTGIYAANSDDARSYIDCGYQLIALSNDVAYLSEGSQAALRDI